MNATPSTPKLGNSSSIAKPKATGRKAETIGMRCLRGRFGGAGNSNSRPAYGRVMRGGRLNSTRLWVATASTARRWSVTVNVRSPMLAARPGPSEAVPLIASPSITTPFLEPRSVTVIVSATVMRAW